MSNSQRDDRNRRGAQRRPMPQGRRPLQKPTQSKESNAIFKKIASYFPENLSRHFSKIVAGGLAVLLFLWLALGNKTPETTPAVAIQEQNQQSTLAHVETQVINAQSFRKTVTLNAYSEAERRVSVTAQTSGIIRKINVDKGTTVKNGHLICQLHADARYAQLKDARAAEASHKLERDAAIRLYQKDYVSKTYLANAQAAYESARAATRSYAVEYDRIYIRAPFKGIIDDIPVRVGDYLTPGMPCATIVDKDPLYVVAYVSENAVKDMRVGNHVTARFITGETIKGKVSFIAETPNLKTRTFRVEMDIPNKKNELRDGVSVEVDIDMDKTTASLIPQGVLVLNDDGKIGVHVVDQQNIVRFRPVSILSDNAEGAWVDGLNSEELLITVGQEFVRAGQEVTTEITHKKTQQNIEVSSR